MKLCHHLPWRTFQDHPVKAQTEPPPSFSPSQSLYCCFLKPWSSIAHYSAHVVCIRKYIFHKNPKSCKAFRSRSKFSSKGKGQTSKKKRSSSLTLRTAKKIHSYALRHGILPERHKNPPPLAFPLWKGVCVWSYRLGHLKHQLSFCFQKQIYNSISNFVTAGTWWC